MDDSFAQLRGLLSETPRAQTWEDLSTLFGAWESDTPIDVALPYGVTHMNNWASEEPESLLASLLDYWQKAPSAALAEVIDQVSTRVTEQRGPVPGKNRKLREAAWRTIFAEGDRVDLTRLVQALPTFLRSTAEELLSELQRSDSRWQRDPRFTKPFLELLSHPPHGYQGWGSVSFWRINVLGLLEDSLDPRLVNPLRVLDAQYQSTRSDTYIHTILRNFTHSVADHIAKVVTAPTPGQVALFEAYLGDLRPTLESPDVQDEIEALYHAVYLDPTSDEPRLALAEYLDAQGDPRGEFIKLQCRIARGEKMTREERKRETALRKEHLRSWLGPFEPVTHTAGLKFERGFPSSLRIGSNQSHLEEAVLGLPEWATISKLDMKAWGVHCDQTDFFEQTSLPSLREVRNACANIFFNATPLPIETLHIIYHQDELPTLIRFAENPSPLPQLRALEIYWLMYKPGEIRPLWETPLFQQLTSFAYTPGYDNRKIAAELPHLAATSLEELKLKQDYNQAWSKTAIRRDDSFTHMLFQCEWPYEMKDAYDGLYKHHLAKMPKNNILQTIEIRLHKKNVRPTQAQVDKVEARLGEFKNLESYELDRP